MKKILFLIAIIAFITSCKKDDPWSEGGIPCVDCVSSGTKPLIGCPTHQQYGNDSLVLKFNFCDKDGDIGLGTNDTTGIFAQGNIWMIYYFKDSTGNWSMFDTDISNSQMDTLIIKYRIPPVPALPITTPVFVGGFPNPVKLYLYSTNTLNGEIQCMIKPLASPHNEIKFDIFIYDKALNKSNTITTTSIYP
jgi:hypothetical protein